MKSYMLSALVLSLIAVSYGKPLDANGADIHIGEKHSPQISNLTTTQTTSTEATTLVVSESEETYPPVHDEHLKSSEIPPDPITKDFRRYIKVGNRTIIDNDNDGYFPEYDSDREVEAEYGKTDPADNNPTPDPTLYW